MTKFAIALAAAALLAAPSFSSSAEAGGIRVGFGFPLGSFVARPHQGYSAAPSYGAQKHYAKKKAAAAARYAKQDAAPVRKAHKPKIAVAERAPVKTANVDNKATVTDAAPTVFVPEATATATPAVTSAAEVKAAETTATVETKTAAIEPVAVKEEVKVEEPKTEKVEKIATDDRKADRSATVKRVCRRFSAAIAGLVDIPCE